jgi:sugar lactone lactonase YvrE
MSNNLLAGAAGGASAACSAGQIWCIGDGRSSAIEAQLGCPNAICWSPDYRTFHIADSGNGWLYAHTFEEDTGSLMPRRPFFYNSALGIPDGAAMDQQGYLWNARWGAGMLIRISPAGFLDRSIRLPVSQPTACCFGDEDLRTLYITTARHGLSHEQLAMEPLAGGVFSLRVDVAGLPLPSFSASGSPIHPYHAAALP